MRLQRVPFGQILDLRRSVVEIEMTGQYQEVGVRSFGRGLFIKDPVMGIDLGNKRVFRICPDDLVISNVFGWEGAVAVADECHRGLIGSHRFMTWVPKDLSETDVRYLAHYFVSDVGLSQLRSASPGSAGRNRTLSVKNLEAIEVPLPRIDEQRWIAAHLGELERALAATRVLGRRAREQLQSSLEGEVTRAAQANTEPFLSLLEPDREWIDLDEAAIYLPIGVRGFGRGLIRYPAAAGGQLSKLRYYGLKADRLVISNIKAWEGAVSVTESQDVGRVASSRFLQFRIIDNRVSLAWVHEYLRSRAGVSQLAAASPGAADRNRTLSISTLQGVRIPVPEAQDQARVAAVGYRVRRAEQLLTQRERPSEALLPAARNEIFSAMH